jgi:hypothetical protein
MHKFTLSQILNLVMKKRESLLDFIGDGSYVDSAVLGMQDDFVKFLETKKGVNREEWLIDDVAFDKLIDGITITLKDLSYPLWIQIDDSDPDYFNVMFRRLDLVSPEISLGQKVTSLKGVRNGKNFTFLNKGRSYE